MKKITIILDDKHIEMLNEIIDFYSNYLCFKTSISDAIRTSIFYHHKNLIKSNKSYSSEKKSFTNK